jgi:hypothetical protein
MCHHHHLHLMLWAYVAALLTLVAARVYFARKSRSDKVSLTSIIVVLTLWLLVFRTVKMLVC